MTGQQANQPQQTERCRHDDADTAPVKAFSYWLMDAVEAMGLKTVTSEA